MLGSPVLEGDEVVASRWRRRWRGVRRRIQAAFLVGVVGVPLAFRAAGSTDYGGPVAGFAALVAAFTVAHLWAGARMWMRPVQVFDEGVIATRVARLVAPRDFARWTQIEDARVEPWGAYGERLVFTLRGGGALHTIPGELDAAAVAGVLGMARRGWEGGADGGAGDAHP